MVAQLNTYKPYLCVLATAVSLSSQTFTPKESPNRRYKFSLVPDHVLEPLHGLFVTLTTGDHGITPQYRQTTERWMRNVLGVEHIAKALEQDHALNRSTVHYALFRSTKPFTFKERRMLLRRHTRLVPGAMPAAHQIDEAAIPVEDTLGDKNGVLRYIGQPYARQLRNHLYATHDLPTQTRTVIDISPAQVPVIRAAIEKAHRRQTGKVDKESPTYGVAVYFDSQTQCVSFVRDILA